MKTVEISRFPKSPLYVILVFFPSLCLRMRLFIYLCSENRWN